MGGLMKILNWSAQVGRLFGIPIRLHITLLFFLWPVVGSSKNLGVAHAVEYVVLVVFCILLHELGHALTAKRYKLTGLSITLHGFGGFAVSRGYRSPTQELVIALAGPAVTFAIGGLALLVGNYGLQNAATETEAATQFFIVHFLGKLNILLGVLNLIPSLPFDGGAAIRALFARKLSDQKATRAVSHLGLVVTAILAVYGLLADQRILTIFALMGAITSVGILMSSGGIRFGEAFQDRKARKANEAAQRERAAKQEAYLSDVTVRQKEREERERLRKLLGSSLDE